MPDHPDDIGRRLDDEARAWLVKRDVPRPSVRYVYPSRWTRLLARIRGGIAAFLR